MADKRAVATTRAREREVGPAGRVATSRAQHPRATGMERVYQALRSEILTLQQPPGQPLDEHTLSQRFGLSRTPVREALVRLAAEGLVLSVASRGTMVAPLDLSRAPAYFDALTLSQRLVTRLAARHHRVEELVRVEALQRAFAAAVGDSAVLAMIEVNRDFHVAVAELGRNPYYTDFYARLLDEGRRLLRLYYASFHDRLPGRFVDEHDALLAAIRARDERLADSLARRHAEQVAAQIRSLLVPDLGATLELDGPDAVRRSASE